MATAASCSAFCHAYGDKVVLLLNGYDKGEDPSGRRQQREIRLARKRLEEFRQPGAAAAGPEEMTLLTEVCHKAHTQKCRRRHMARTLNDYLERSGRANSAGVRDARSVFDQAYSLARQIVELREKHGLTQVQLSEATGIPQAQISKIERGVISPTSATLAKIAEALGSDLRLVER